MEEKEGGLREFFNREVYGKEESKSADSSERCVEIILPQAKGLCSTKGKLKIERALFGGYVPKNAVIMTKSPNCAATSWEFDISLPMETNKGKRALLGCVNRSSFITFYVGIGGSEHWFDSLDRALEFLTK